MTHSPTPQPARGPGQGPTSHDVARQAGVSQSTVSLVFRDVWRGRVAVGTRQRVLEAARELGFRPNIAARWLRQGAPTTVLVAVPTIVNPFFGRILAGAREAAGNAGCQVLLSVQPELGGVAADMHGQGVDAVLACCLEDGAAAISPETPMLVLDADPPPGRCALRFDVAPALRSLVDRLHALGHRRLLHVCADVGTSTFAERADAVTHACAARGLTRRSVSVPIDPEAARTEVRRILTEDTGRQVTAVVCDDDLLAAGAYKAARDIGRSVPEELSVSGVDDVDLARLLTPELTTIALPGVELGRVGMGELLAELGELGEPVGQPARRPRVRRLEAQLRVRDSTVAAPVRS